MRRILIDAHVHLHPGADPVATLTAAHDRMVGMAGGEALSLFMLAEQQGHDMFDALRSFAEATDEAESLWLRHDGADLLVLAGRQVISAERLEVLALATDAHFDDGLPARDLVSAMLAQDALVILPWGIGKWLGRRGNLVDRLADLIERIARYLQADLHAPSSRSSQSRLSCPVSPEPNKPSPSAS
jgi:hypothetical protein